MPAIQRRVVPAELYQQLCASGVSPLLARLFASRGVADTTELDPDLRHLLPYQGLLHCEAMAVRLADAIAAQQRLLIIGDYDADGATATALAMQGLAAMGARVDFLVPNRFKYGYGLTPDIVTLASTYQPDILVTVDNGIASIDGVNAAHALGMEVLVTDHHAPGDTLPAALIVNPSQPGCTFASKHLAGVGVMFYVLIALRAELRARGAFAAGKEPNLAQWLDLVALGTVADVVRLDANNRRLVAQGLARIRSGRAAPGILALFAAARRDPARATAMDLGFFVGPRLNAAGRLDDMSKGILCLLSHDAVQAQELANMLDELNRERRDIEATMQADALATLDDIQLSDRYTVVACRDDFHQGVIGIVAARLKEKFYRPTLVFAPGHEGELKGSGRSIPGFHLRDAIDLVSKRAPHCILRFGGHAAAAGLTIPAAALPEFSAAFEAVAREWLDAAALTQVIQTDGELQAADLSLAVAAQLTEPVWGQGFPAPLFEGGFRVLGQRVLKEKHLKLQLAHPEGTVLDGILFNHADPLPDHIHAVYRLDCNEWQGKVSLQVMLEHVTAH
jgi:single-stranded-DNA-specific exonuclease